MWLEHGIVGVAQTRLQFMCAFLFQIHECFLCGIKLRAVSEEQNFLCDTEVGSLKVFKARVTRLPPKALNVRTESTPLNSAVFNSAIRQ